MKLDDKFALGEASKPFSNAIKQTFTTGNVLPLVSGAFAEVNAEAKRLVEKCARHAAALEQENLKFGYHAGRGSFCERKCI